MSKWLLIEKFLQETVSCDDLSSLDKCYQKALEQLGFPTFSHSFYNKNPTDKYLHDICSPFLKSWHAHFIKQGYENVDTIGEKVRRNIIPVSWDLETSLQQASPQQKTLYQDALDAGLKAGMSFPVHDSGHEVSVLVIHQNKTAKSIEKDLAISSVLHQMAVFYHHHLKRLINNPYKEIYHLTAREKECLQWSAKFKTALEIADILNVSTRTISFHIENANKKLRVRTKYEAVAKAINLGLIE